MTKVVEVRWMVKLMAGLVLAAGMLPAAWGQANAGEALTGVLADAAKVVLKQGKHAKMPPHLSTLLRLSTEAETPILQGILRVGSRVQGFDVSEANHDDLILFVADEVSGSQDFYLTSLDGTLRRVVEVRSGVGNEVRLTDARKEAFEKEKKFWVTRLQGMK